MASEYPITLAELAEANILTAPKMGFMLDSGANQIHEHRGTLQKMILTGHKVKIILAKSGEQGENMKKPETHLGIFYHTQSAATCAYALCYYLAGEASRFPELAGSNDELCYGPIKTRYSELISVKSPIIAGIQLIGGGEIHSDIKKDAPGSFTLQTNFALSDIPHEYMALVRRLVLEELGIEHSV